MTGSRPRLIILNIIEFARNSKKIIESSRMQDRRGLFGILLSNSVIDGRKAWFCLKKPFDSLLKSNGYLTWLDITRTYRVENPDDFISLGRVCEIFLNNWMNTPQGALMKMLNFILPFVQYGR